MRDLRLRLNAYHPLRACYSVVESRSVRGCGCRLGVEISFKDICILAAVLTVDAEHFTNTATDGRARLCSTQYEYRVGGYGQRGAGGAAGREARAGVRCDFIFDS
eukprot:scaffold3367_cov52-Phaeocystis_antarctica.AAC.4